MDADRNPIKGPGERFTECRRYDSCLDGAIDREWRSWNCESCPLYQERERTTSSSGSINGQGPSRGRIVKERKTKICASCEKEKDLDDFQPHYRTADGRMNVCRVCHGRASVKGTEKARNRMSKAKSKGTILRVDLTDYPEVLNSLPDAAHKRIRTPEEQAIAYVVRGLKEDGYKDASEIKE